MTLNKESLCTQKPWPASGREEKKKKRGKREEVQEEEQLRKKLKMSDGGRQLLKQTWLG